MAIIQNTNNNKFWKESRMGAQLKDQTYEP
jgi:hypothetical protein